MSTGPHPSENLLLALDLGNTNLNCGLFHLDRLIARTTTPVALLTDSPRIWDGLFASDLLSRVTVSLLSSVNPPAASLVLKSLHRRLDRPPLLLGAALPIPVQARVDRPSEVGSDRLLNVLAAFHRYPASSFIVDLGTALTIDVCSADGAYLGGVIAPGLAISASALHRQTALLPDVHVARPVAVTGRNTVDCIRSGLFWGSVSTIEGLVTRLRSEHPDTRKVFATGGAAALIAADCPVIDEVLPDLHLEGLHLVALSAGLLS